MNDSNHPINESIELTKEIAQQFLDRTKEYTDSQYGLGLIRPFLLDFIKNNRLGPLKSRGSVYELVVDDQLISSHIGVTDPKDTYEIARKKVYDLIFCEMEIQKYFKSLE